MSEIAISVNNISKMYKLYENPMDRLKESLGLTRKKRYKEHYALNNVSFQVKKGETVGIIGTNGSGKSTILKIITGVLNPTQGEVVVDGRISALLELGAGFNGEYSGIENVYLNGQMIGFSKEEIDAKLEEDKKVDYDRIGERMCAEMLYVNYAGNGVDKYVSLVTKAAATGKVLVLGCEDADAAKAALEVCKAGKPILNGANASNYEEMSKLATEAGVVLGVSGANIDELHDTVEAIEKLGNKNLVLDTTEATIKETFATTVQVRRASLKDTDRTFGYPSIVNLAKIAQGDRYMQQALLSLFTMKYGSIIVLEEMGYAEALPVFGLRQNVFTDPQKPMKVEPGIYPLNGADENSICLTTVDFALTYFLGSGELERSGVPVNLVINDAGGLSVLTSWAAGKFSGNSISKFFKENVEDKVKSRKVIIPGKVAVLKGDIESKLPGWEVIVAPLEAVQLVKFMKDLQANGEL